jgi:DNA-binding CsgD family transcriptional regulator
VDVYERLSGRDASELDGGQLEALADAAWLLCRLEESTAARQQSYVRYLDAGENGPAARTAWRLFWEGVYTREAAVAMGWLRRARRHLASMPEAAEHGLVALADAELALNRGRLEQAAASALRAIEVADRHRAQGIVALGLTLHGRILIAQGDREEGLACLDEAMTLVLGGRLDDYFAGAVYCAVIAECRDLADIRRGSEWTDAARAWCAALQATTPFHGICRIHRGEILCLRGAWEEAESEIRAAGDELATFKPGSAAEAFYALGELHRRQGDISAAEDAFLRAHQLGRDPHPGLAYVRVAQGRPETASSALRAALAGESGAPMQRARLLTAYVETLLSAGEVSLATDAADELTSIARVLDSPAVDASAAAARGSVRLASGDPGGAIADLRTSCAVWRDLGMPYEEAQTRLLIGGATRALGDEEGAVREIDAAVHAFERLGARTELQRAVTILGPSAFPAGLTTREVEVLRLVAAGRTNRDIATELVISEHTVSRHLHNIFTKLGVSSRAAATAFAFEHRLA